MIQNIHRDGEGGGKDPPRPTYIYTTYKHTNIVHMIW